MNQQHWETWEIDDLRIIKSEAIVDDENGEISYCVYSFKLDAVSFVEEDEINLLQERGIQALDDLPTK